MKRKLISLLMLSSSISHAQDCVWELEPTPSPEGSILLFGIDGVTHDNVWSAGEQFIFNFPETKTLNYIAHWNGSNWSQADVPQPSVLRESQHLSGVLAISENDAIAVGTYNPPSGSSLAQSLRWDGSNWELMESPVFPGGSGFQSIGKAGNDVWACGSKHSELPPPAASVYPMAARLNGDDWEVIFVPPLAETGGRSYNYIHAIEGATEDDAWAGGIAQEQGTGFGPAAMMIHWDGSEWSQYDLTQIVDSEQFSSIESIEVLDADNAWAAGFDYDLARQVTIPLILHWDGSAWSNIPIPTFEHSAELRAITARSSDDIYASGTKTFGDGYPHALILHWDGNAWSEVSESALTDYGTWFRAMASVNGELWAAGQSNDLGPGITHRQLDCASNCDADINNDGKLNFLDISEFLSLMPDFNMDGLFNFFDVSAFLNSIGAGCP